MTHFADRLEFAIQRCGAPAVVGIDPVLEKLPAALKPRELTMQSAAAALRDFSRGVIDAVAPIAPAVKINSAFFEACYEAGVAAYFDAVEYSHSRGLIVIGDIKRGDIGSTAQLYARGHLASPAVADAKDARIPDAVTLAGYLGRSAIAPFVDAAQRAGRGLYVLVRPSDPDADIIHEFGGENGRRLYQFMGELVTKWGGERALMGERGLSCVGAVVAPKDAASTRALRAAMPHTPFLVPGYGAQGGTADACAACFRASTRDGAIVNASRSVIYAFDEPRYRAHFGDDWQAAVRAASLALKADLGGLTALRP